MSMIVNRIQGWRAVDLTVSLLGCSALVLGLYSLQVTYRGEVPSDGSYQGLWAAAMAGLTGHALARSKKRRTALGLAMSENLLWVCGQTAAVAFAIFALLVLSKDSGVSRLYLLTFLGVLPVGLVAVRKIALKWLAPVLFDQRHQCGALLVGSPMDFAHVVEWLRSKKSYGLEVLGYVSNEPDSPVVPIPRLGDHLALERILAEHKPGVVIASGFEHMGQNWLRLRDLCDRHGSRLAFSLGAGVDLTCGLTCYQEDGVNLLALRNEPLESPFNRFVKRGLDMALALPVVLLILPPLALAVWLLQRFQSPGPLLFKQERTGLRGRPFVMFKFRTMHVNNPDEALQATAKDPRVYRGGGLLRRLSLDEFPQFINVLLGHMSVVGPRPHFVAHDDWFAGVAGSYRVRTLIKPGITGLAQVKGFRGPTITNAHIESRTREDLYYLEHWSLSMDLVIILRTLVQFFRGARNAV